MPDSISYSLSVANPVESVRINNFSARGAAARRQIVAAHQTLSYAWESGRNYAGANARSAGRKLRDCMPFSRRRTP